LLPAGAMSLGLALQTNLSVEIGMQDDEVAKLSLWSTVVSGVFMVIGGQLSDKWGRRRTLFVYLAGMSLPVLYLMWHLQQHGYVMPRPPGGPVIPELVAVLWIATLWYAVFQGLMYGTRSAIFMDVTNPAVAATQFTAYMAMMNLAIAIAASWQGLAVEAWGYPVTLLVDAITGLLCLLFLPALKRTEGFSDDRAPARARKAAIVLGAACAVWVPYWFLRDYFGKGQPIAATFFTLVFVGSALFLLAGREVLGAEMRRWRVAALWMAPLLLAMYGRNFLAKLDAMSALRSAAEGFVVVVPLAAAVVLFAFARGDWRAVSGSPAGGAS
jgi:PAT family beta-lactamase induction signal transducer AmpG